MIQKTNPRQGRSQPRLNHAPVPNSSEPPTERSGFNVPAQRLLLISFLFPPAGGIAVQRALSLARYLPRNGYEVHVLAARNSAAPVVDPGLLKLVPGEVTVHHAFMPTVSFDMRQKLRRFFVPGGSKPQPAQAADAKPKSAGGRPSFLSTLVRRLLCPDPEVLWHPFALRAAT